MSTDRPSAGTGRAKEAAAKKVAAKKVVAKKVVAKTVAAKKAAAKKVAAKKAAAKTVAAKKVAAKKAGTTRATTRATPTTTAPSTSVPPGRLEGRDDVIQAAGAIIDVFERRPDLYLAACANPVRALRDAGVELSPSAERWVAHRCRFSPEETEELDRLSEQISSHLGDVDPDDDNAVRRSLRGLGVDVPLAAKPPARVVSARGAEMTPSPPERVGRQRQRSAGPAKELHRVRRSVMLAAEQLPQVRRWREARRPATDPLAGYAGAHAVMTPLLEYRRRSATRPRFAPDELYERLAATTGGQLASGINIELHVRFTGDGSG